MIELKNVTKTFVRNNQTVTAVNNLSISVKQGEVFGLIGSNGAGKTTTLRMIASTLKPSQGEIIVAGYNVVQNPEQVRKNIGILFGGDTGLYDRLTAKENIEYFAKLNGLSQEETDNNMQELVKAFNLEGYLNRRTGGFSRGMKQKTSFARSIIHNPQVMLFDEPTAGLDILASDEVVNFIKQCKQKGKTIILSSHDMLEVDELCDRIAIINKGRILIQGTLEEVKNKTNSQSTKEAFIKLIKQDNVISNKGEQQ